MSLVLVTGASTGLGLATARALADDGHEVVLHARRRSRVQDQALLPRMRAVIEGDLGDTAQTREVAAQAEQIGRFDAVIHNAGVLDGPELVAVNVVAPYLLTASMTPPRRAVFLSSSMHRSGTPQLPERLDRVGASYSDTKLWVTLLAMSLATRWSGTLAHAVDPGWVPTRMGGAGASDDLDEGHRTQAWLATTDVSHLEPRTGGYWYHHRPARPHPAALVQAHQDALLTRLEEVTWVALPS